MSTQVRKIDGKTASSQASKSSEEHVWDSLSAISSNVDEENKEMLELNKSYEDPQQQKSSSKSTSFKESTEKDSLPPVTTDVNTAVEPASLVFRPDCNQAFPDINNMFPQEGNPSPAFKASRHVMHSSPNASPNLSNYKSVVSPITLPSFSKKLDALNESPRLGDIKSPPSFKSQFAKTLSASSSMLFDDVSNGNDLSSIGNAASSNLDSEDMKENSIPLSQICTKLNNNSQLTPSSQVANLLQEIMNTNTGNARNHAPQPLAVSKMSGNEPAPLADFSGASLLLKSCMEATKICSDLVEGSKKKLDEVFSHGMDFNFNSSFDQMFESVVEDDDMFNSPELDEAENANKLTASNTICNVNKNSISFIDDSSNGDDEASKVKSKISRDEMDVDFFLSGDSSKISESCDNKSKENQAKLDLINSSMESEIGKDKYELNMPSYFRKESCI